jgi:hypothetical protein
MVDLPDLDRSAPDNKLPTIVSSENFDLNGRRFTYGRKAGNRLHQAKKKFQEKLQ